MLDRRIKIRPTALSRLVPRLRRGAGSGREAVAGGIAGWKGADRL